MTTTAESSVLSEHEGGWVATRPPRDRHALRHLAPEAASGRAARQFVERFLVRSGWPRPGTAHDLQDLQDILLLTSELAINAASHAHSPMDVTVHYRQGSQVRVEVHDEGAGIPQARWPATFEETGRGLALVELLSEAWGVTDCPAGKTVWFELRLH
ncbi:MAG: ATP-binding protein [Acidimicrobiales bacterium]